MTKEHEEYNEVSTDKNYKGKLDNYAMTSLFSFTNF